MIEPEARSPSGARAVLILAAFLAVSFAPPLVAFLAAGPMPGEWYESLAKPSFTPPGWLFGPVWTALYVTIAVAGFLAWRRRSAPGARPALLFWAVQLALNAAWSPVFFGLEDAALAFAVIALLWTALVVTVILFFRVSPAAGLLLVPYLAWTSFASALNYEIWRLNA